MFVAALFPGQGSQVVGMGRELFESNPIAAEAFRSADKVLGFELSRLCFQGPMEELTKTENAQPAILTVSIAAFRAFGHTDFAAAAGHSLSEYSALVGAGSLNFEDAVQLVHKRGRYLQEAVPLGAGTMVAVMGPDENSIQEAIQETRVGLVQIANLNCPGQTVIAGDVQGVAAFAEVIKSRSGKVIPLNVSAPFHCSLMKPAAEKLARDLDAITFCDPQFPAYANFTAEAVTRGSDARQLLKDQVCGSVRWTESMQNMIRKRQISTAFEFGPGGVLGKLLKRIDKSVRTVEICDSKSIAEAIF